MTQCKHCDTRRHNEVIPLCLLVRLLMVATQVLAIGTTRLLIEALRFTYMASPPSYSASQGARGPTYQAHHDPVPPYKASHRFASEAEERAALEHFAQSKLYVSPGADGTLPNVAQLRWSGLGQTSEPGPINTLEMKADRRRQKEEKRVQKAEARERRGSVGDRLKRVMSSGAKKHEQ